MTEGRWSSGQPARIWSAGEYTLLADSHTITEEGVTYSKGDTFFLREKEATRLGNAGAIASPEGMQAVKARTRSVPLPDVGACRGVGWLSTRVPHQTVRL